MIISLVLAGLVLQFILFVFHSGFQRTRHTLGPKLVTKPGTINERRHKDVEIAYLATVNVICYLEPPFICLLNGSFANYNFLPFMIENGNPMFINWSMI